MNWLRGKEVKLRAVEPKDIDHLLTWENHSGNWQLSGTIGPFSRNLMERYIDNAQQDIYEAGQQRFMIEAAGNQTIGTVDIFDFDPFHERAGVGILVGDKAYRENGYATESLELLRDYCFNYLNLKQLYCNILVENEVSIRLFQKLGFEITGTKKGWIRCGREFKDEYFLQLLRKD